MLERAKVQQGDSMLARERLSFAAKLIASVGFAVAVVLYALPLFAQGLLRERLQRSLGQQKTGENAVRADSSDIDRYVIAGLKVAVWKPRSRPGPYPLVMFSHGYHGSSTQSKSIMQALAQAGYLVIAPNHQDALGNVGALLVRPEQPFQKASRWTDSTFKKRGDDIVRLMDALHNNPEWNSQIDWSKVALAGHSLGGYTVLALAGAWPSWKLPGIKAVLALSPYCEPFVEKGTLSGLAVPIMYQGGTRDLGITPTVKRPNGAFSKTSSPAYFVEFDNAGHFSWTNLNKSQVEDQLITHYAVSFLDKYVKSDPEAKPDVKLSGVTALQVK
jgi:predicted dienelactone hydrolase